jgi:ribonuclease Y
MLLPVAFNGLEIIISVLLGVLGFVTGYFIRVWQREKSLKQTRELTEKIVEDGKKEAEKAKRESVLEAKQEIFALRKEFDLTFIY